MYWAVLPRTLFAFCCFTFCGRDAACARLGVSTHPKLIPISDALSHAGTAACSRRRLLTCCVLWSAEQDLGKNFFVTQASLGEARCQVITTLLLELNEEVKGTAVDDDPVELINKSSDFFSKFSCVIATDLPESALLKLASELWTKEIPLCVGRAYGMIGLWRNVIPEVCIIESRPEYMKENYRIASSFPQLEAFVGQYDLETCKHPHLPLTETPAGPGKYTDSQGRATVPKAHSHTPAFVLLIKVNPRAFSAPLTAQSPLAAIQHDTARESGAVVTASPLTRW